MSEPAAASATQRPFWWPLAWLALQLQLVGLGLNSLAWNGVALLLYPLLPRAVGQRIGRTMIAYGYRIFWGTAALSRMIRLDADVLDTLRDDEGLIVVANHPSLLDAVMIVARLPRAACIMKASLVHNPFLGPGARLARYIRNDSAYGMVQCAVRDLKEGGQLVLFPEGTRTTQAPVNDFHASFAIIAKRAQAPVQVVFIDTTSPYLGKGWPLWRLPPLPIRFAVRLGPRFPPPQDHHTLLAEVRACFVAGVQPAAPDA
jgi:1-acyl-sn-glycerol-3-phosphate acyltransferase